MARIRSIKPEFWTSQTLAQVSPSARLLFIATWTYSDDRGRFQAAPALLGSQAFPMDGIAPGEIERMVAELAGAGVIRLYQQAGKLYGEVANWKEHQPINRPSPSRFPEPDPAEFTEPSLNGHGGLSEDSPPEQGAGSREQGAGSREPEQGKNHLSSDERSTALARTDIDQVWSAYQAHHPQSALTDKRRKLIRARLKEGRTPADLVAAIEGCHASDFHRGANDRHRRFDTIELILRDAGKVEDFMQMWMAPAPKPETGIGRAMRIATGGSM